MLFMKALLPLILALTALVSGCAHGPRYNDVIAVTTAALNERTNAALADGDAGRLSLADSRRFLRQSRDQVRIMRSRADECRMSVDEVNILDWLDGEYTTLLRRSRPVRSASTLRLQNSLATLQTLRPVRIYSVETGDTVATASSDSFDSNTCDTQKKKDCDKDHDRHRDHDHHDHDHGGHDRGDKDCGCDRDHR
jgi:hypothetical protein